MRERAPGPSLKKELTLVWEVHMEHLLNRKLKGNRGTRVKEHTQRAKKIAAVIWTRFHVGPYQYQVKHLKWYLDTKNSTP